MEYQMRFLPALILILLSPAFAFAAPLEEAKAALEHKDYAAAFKIIKPLAEQGQPEAQYLLGNQYLYGQGVNRDEREGPKWIQKSADNGYAPAQIRVGHWHESRKNAGNDLEHWIIKEHNNQEAIKWYMRAADQGSTDAETQIALIYWDGGLNLPKDEKEGLRWFHKAAEHGNRFAQLHLARVYKGDFGKENVDYSEALKWLLLLAEQNDSGARMILGSMYANGEGVKQDYAQAYMWTHLQTETRWNGPSDQELIERMTPEQIAEGKRLVDGWRSKHSLPPAASIDYDTIRSGKH
jgi:TPR repeat protein